MQTKVRVTGNNRKGHFTLSALTILLRLIKVICQNVPWKRSLRICLLSKQGFTINDMPSHSSLKFPAELPCARRAEQERVEEKPPPPLLRGSRDKSSPLSFRELSVPPPDVDQISWAGTNLQGLGTGIFPRRKHFASNKVNMISFKENFFLFF